MKLIRNGNEMISAKVSTSLRNVMMVREFIHRLNTNFVIFQMFMTVSIFLFCDDGAIIYS